MRVFVSFVALGLITACAPEIPDSAAGVGFNNSIEEGRARQAAQEPRPLAPVVPETPAISGERLPAADATPLAPPRTPARVASASPQAAAATTQNAGDIAQETAAALAASASNSGVEPLQASPDNPPPPRLSNPGISDENDFTAVASRESIESDAARIQRNRARYEVVQPTALPSRPSDGQPNIVSYALSTQHQPGTKVYSRAGINMAARAARNCATFPSSDQAQIAFLSSGGPERDRKGLDPDGDGFACSWDPSPFRKAVRN